MGSYFVVLHSTPEGGGSVRRKFVLELAKRLGRKEQEVDILLTDLPAVVTASPTKDFAEALCEAIENLGGLAETMSEVSGIHMAIPAGAEKAAFKAPKKTSAVTEKPKAPLQPVTDPGLSFATSEKPAAIEVAETPKAETPKAPPSSLSASLDGLTLSAESSVEDNGLAEAPHYSPPSDQLGGFVPVAGAVSEKEKKGAAPSAPNPTPEKKPDKKGPNTKSRNSLSVISAFSPKEPKKVKSGAKIPAVSHDVGVPSVEANADDEEVYVSPKKKKVKAKGNAKRVFLFTIFGLLLVGYIVVLINPDLVRTDDENVSVSVANVKNLLKQQDQILHDLSSKQANEKPKEVKNWVAEELSGSGSLSLLINSADEIWDGGNMVLTTPTAAPLSPEEFSRGAIPRVWIKELVVDKLRKTGKPDELSGKAKITIADERSLDKIVASVVVTLSKSDIKDVITGKVEVFFPSVTSVRPDSDILKREADGQQTQLTIYHRRDFSARVIPPVEKVIDPNPKSSSKRGKPLVMMPVI